MAEFVVVCKASYTLNPESFMQYAGQAEVCLPADNIGQNVAKCTQSANRIA